MTCHALVAIPFLAGAAALFLRPERGALRLLVCVAVLHLGLTLSLLPNTPPPAAASIGLDLPGALFLGLTSLLFFGVSLHVPAYVRHVRDERDVSLRLFVPCLLWFLAAMTLVTLSQNLALLWAAIEATTLASAPLVYVLRRRGALEGTWKYLLLCSVGIALALLGTYFLGIAASGVPGRNASFLLRDLLAAAPAMSGAWFRAAFIMALVGYGTKMGLAPLHTWLPDTHGQAPAPVSALLSGALLNCAFLGILRFFQIALATGDAAFARSLLLALGFLSVALAAVFLVGQADYKRLLAYSSVENMGILAIGVGLGGAATFGAMFHALNHSLCKASLFLLAGNVLHRHGTTRSDRVHGVLRSLPATGVLLAVAFLAIGGAPPFAPFMSKLVIFRGLFHELGWPVAAAFLLLLTVAFLGMADALLGMLQGSPSHEEGPAREDRFTLITPLAFCTLVLLLGLHLPASLSSMLHRLAAMLGGGHV